VWLTLLVPGLSAFLLNETLKSCNINNTDVVGPPGSTNSKGGALLEDDEKTPFSPHDDDSAPGKEAITAEDGDPSALLRAKHPACFDEALFETNEDGVKTLKFSTAAECVCDDTACAPPCDTCSCAVMKARCNCGLNSAAHHWKLVLQPPSSGKVCDLRTFVQDLGGPAGLALAAQAKSAVLFGNSHLRQAFEVMTCLWRDQLSDLMVQEGGPGASLADIANCNERGCKIQFEQMGDIQHLQLPPWDAFTTGSHGVDADSIQKCCVAEAPKTLGSCDDNFAAAEFDSSIRFHCVFRPFLCESFDDVCHQLDGLQADAVDACFLTKPNGPERKIVVSGTPAGMRQHITLWPIGHCGFQKLQERDTGQWCGADNPWISRPPDDHACMSGMPDDSANLFLCLLHHNTILPPDAWCNFWHEPTTEQLMQKGDTTAPMTDCCEFCWLASGTVFARTRGIMAEMSFNSCC